MPVYEIEQYELHTLKYRIDADDPAEAIVKLLDGEAEPVDDSQEYVEVADERGMLVAEHPELAAKLRTLGVPVDDRIIPSIRSIEVAEAEGFTDPLTELVRARTPEEAAEIIHEFLLYESDKPIQCQRLTVTPLCEPEDGIGIVYEPAGCDTCYGFDLER